MSRPTLYSDEMVKKAADYLENYEQHEHAFPSVVGLAYVLGIRRETAYDWAKQPDKIEFSNILGKIKDKQELVAWQKGLKGEYNANLVKLLLGKHGFSDKAEVDNTHKYPDKIVIEHVPVDEDDQD